MGEIDSSHEERSVGIYQSYLRVVAGQKEGELD